MKKITIALLIIGTISARSATAQVITNSIPQQPQPQQTNSTMQMPNTTNSGTTKTTDNGALNPNQNRPVRPIDHTQPNRSIYSPTNTATPTQPRYNNAPATNPMRNTQPINTHPVVNPNQPGNAAPGNTQPLNPPNHSNTPPNPAR